MVEANASTSAAAQNENISSVGENERPNDDAGGIHTNDHTTVKQYFNYYAKLAN